MHPPPVLPPVPQPGAAHLVNVAIGPGPHTLQQLEAVPRILQRHVPQQRHGPAPDRPAGASCGAGAERRGAGRGEAGGQAGAAPRLGGRRGGAMLGRGQPGDAPPPAWPRGGALVVRGKSLRQGRSLGPPPNS